MNTAQLTALFTALDNNVWEALCNGQSLVLKDDQRLELGQAVDSNVMLLPQADKDPLSLRKDILASADECLNNYYKNNPLSPEGFRRQLELLIEQYGFAAFSAVYPDAAELTVFVDVGELVAEGQDSPRHRYGAYCELEERLVGDELNEVVKDWVESGEAYDSYIAMNVCRYSCRV